MFDSSIELKETRLTLHGDTEELKNSLSNINRDYMKEHTVELQVSFNGVDEYMHFIKLDFEKLRNMHVVLNISSSIFDTINITPIIENFLIKNIQFFKGSIQINLYKPQIVNSELVENNQKIYNEFINSDFYYWNPSYNSINELLVLSNNMLDEYNQTLLKNKEMNSKLQKLKSIVKDL
ncbi:MAG TPA: hypothetical protein VK105_15600 [Virgibacillus sp.]|nr:hypothetical protein [Virgibacillus sp.]HLR68526.1 hypothetical protein [Virgibacillus sp.]